MQVGEEEEEGGELQEEEEEGEGLEEGVQGQQLGSRLQRPGLNPLTSRGPLPGRWRRCDWAGCRRRGQAGCCPQRRRPPHITGQLLQGSATEKNSYDV